MQKYKINLLVRTMMYYSFRLRIKHPMPNMPYNIAWIWNGTRRQHAIYSHYTYNTRSAISKLSCSWISHEDNMSTYTVKCGACRRPFMHHHQGAASVYTDKNKRIQICVYIKWFVCVVLFEIYAMRRNYTLVKQCMFLLIG